MYFFSGTGNARNVARWMVDAWRRRGQDAEAFDLGKPGGPLVDIGPDDVVGLASPTHGFNFPPITLAFLFAFPRAPRRNRVLILNTRAGLRLFGLCLPGLSGVAQLLAALVFLLKGYRVVGMRPIDLPSNWISIHPGLREDNVRILHERCEAVTRRFADRLLDGRRDYRALFDLIQDLLIAPIALGYYFAGRFLFAKSFIASRDCDACGVCVQQCPLEAVRLVDGRPFWSWRCESCMHCMNRCPRRAIETGHGFLAVSLALLYVALAVLVYPALRPVVPVLADEGFAGQALRFVLENVLMLSSVFLGYRLLHSAMRFRVVERLATLTSLTHFAFWRRYRAPRAPTPGPVACDEVVAEPGGPDPGHVPVGQALHGGNFQNLNDSPRDEYSLPLP
jgi:ferredoxin